MRSSFYFCLFLLLLGCANVRPPVGGEKDVQAPLIESSIPANGTTSFSGNSISISFDERIQLSSPNKNIIISPPLLQNPTIKLSDSRTLTISIDDELRKNTTYTINVSEAVSDLTESNKAQNATLVFSTGEQLDSLRISGTVLDAFDLSGEEHAQVIMIPKGDTTDITNSKPYYLARSSKTGQFTLSNLRKGAYYLYALQDLNGNSIYDLPKEKIAFASGGISLPDTSLQEIILHAFVAKSKEQTVLDYSIGTNWGLTLIMSQASDSIHVTPLNDIGVSATFIREHHAGSDTSIFWPSDSTLIKGQRLVVLNGTTPIDTIRYRPKAKLPFSIGLRSVPASGANSLRFVSSRPFTKVNTEKFYWLPDSLGTCEVISVDSLGPRTVEVSFPEIKSTVLRLLPGAVEGYFNSKNDTVVLKRSSLDPKSTGRLTIEIEPGKGESKLFQLLNDKGRQVREASELEAGKIVWNKILPGDYRIRIIHDRNGDLKWDTGDLASATQAETVEFYPDLITVRAGWKLELQWP